VKLHLKVVPKSSADRIAGWMGDALKVCVTAAPERGKANEAVQALLARNLGLKRGQVRVVAGHSAARKVVEIDGLTEAEVRRRLTLPG
jgi:uncharacterized protein YggU (UPF0235/DUF167 family)